MTAPRWWSVSVVTTLLLAGCATTVPPGPSVMVLPGSDKNFEQFQLDDSICRQWALQQTGNNPGQAFNTETATGAAVGTVVGAATGAAIGAAAGDPALGAAVGSGVGLMGGTAAGSNRGASAEWSLQRRYDIAYMQCMYTKGNQIPVPAGTQQASSTYSHHGAGAPGMRSGPEVPPPPSGSPPPPPPGAW